MDLESLQTSDSILAVTKENQALKLKADEVDSKFNSLVKQFQKKKTTPVSQKIFFRPNKSYDKIRSQIQYDQIVEQIKVKRANYSKEKEKLDLKDCTFKPIINSNSMTMAASNYVKPIDRPLPKKPKSANAGEDVVYQGITEDIPKERLDSMINKNLNDRACLTEEEWEKIKAEALAKGEPEPPKPEIFKKPKHLNKKFYEEQYMWKTQIEQKYATERLYLTKKELEGFNPTPKINKEVNEKLVKTNKDFLSRLQDDLKKSKVALKTLEQKYYAFDFRPQINDAFTTSRNIQSTYRYEPPQGTTRDVNKKSVDKQFADQMQFRSERNAASQIVDPPSLEIGKGRATALTSKTNPTISQATRTSDIQSRKPTNNSSVYNNLNGRESRDTNYSKHKGSIPVEVAAPVFVPPVQAPISTEKQRLLHQKEIMKMFNKKFK